MNKKWLLGIILVITFLTIIIILILTHNTKYNKLIISKDKWNNIIGNRNKSTSISIKNIKFNDYNLLIDEDNNTIYYSVVDVKNKYNPSVQYNLSNKLKLVINKELTDEVLENDNTLKIMIYDNNSYRIYKLVATNYPILNMNYNEDDSDKKIDIELEVFDNNIVAPIRVIKSLGKLKILEKDKEYILSLKKESLGHNKRDNHISLFGMDKQNEYLIKATDTTNKNEIYVQLFINNKYKGIYIFGHGERRDDIFERNKQNNG